MAVGSGNGIDCIGHTISTETGDAARVRASAVRHVFPPLTNWQGECRR